MSVNDEQQHKPDLLQALPGPVILSIWSTLQPNDKLALFQLCRGMRDRVLRSCIQGLGFMVTSEASSGPWPLLFLRDALSSPQPMKKFELSSVKPRLRGKAGRVLATILQLGAAGAGIRWHAAAGLRELSLQGVRITAEVATLLPQVFPGLSKLNLAHCQFDTAGLLTSLRSCQRLSTLALTHPTFLDPEGLWAEGAAEAAASGHTAALEAAVPWKLEADKCAAATGVLLGSLSSLTTLTLDVRSVPAALQTLVLGGAGARLTDLSVSCPSWAHPSAQMGLAWSDQILAALQHCACLGAFTLGFALPFPGVVQLALSPALCGLRSLCLPSQRVDQAGLDAILQGLPVLHHLTVASFWGLAVSRADAACSWASLELWGDSLDVAALAFLPLHSLKKPLELFHGSACATLRLCVPDEQAEALLGAAMRNIKRSKRMVSAPGLADIRLNQDGDHPFLVCLLPFLPPAEQLTLYMAETGASDVALLRQAGACLARVHTLTLHGARLLPDFWSDELWAALPALERLHLVHAFAHEDTRVEDMVQCFAAAPRPVVIHGLLMGLFQRRKLDYLLAVRPCCKVQLVAGSWE